MSKKNINVIDDYFVDEQRQALINYLESQKLPLPIMVYLLESVKHTILEMEHDE